MKDMGFWDAAIALLAGFMVVAKVFRWADTLIDATASRIKHGPIPMRGNADGEGKADMEESSPVEVGGSSRITGMPGFHLLRYRQGYRSTLDA